MTDARQTSSEYDAPLTDLQFALSRAVEAAQKLPKESVSREYGGLCRVYIEQIVAAVYEARSSR